MTSDLSDYDYALPENLIAQTAVEPRDSSRLLALDRLTGTIQHLRFNQLFELLNDDDLVVLNETRVTALRLWGQKETGGEVELLLMRPDARPATFVALARPAKRLRPGIRIGFLEGLNATVLENLGEGTVVAQFEPVPDLEAKLQLVGRVPLPPYIQAPLKEAERYQTVYSATPGSAAAPTAGLHFTHEILSRLNTVTVSLDVGLDTFRPIQDLATHVMHGETCRISPSAAEKINGHQGRIVAVGTTCVRTLESMAVAPGRVEAGEVTTKLFIQPGTSFKVVQAMFTNFHMPRTTMLMMCAALCGRENLLSAYKEAVLLEYRFLSFGDSMFIG